MNVRLSSSKRRGFYARRLGRFVVAVLVVAALLPGIAVPEANASGRRPTLTARDGDAAPAPSAEPSASTPEPTVTPSEAASPPPAAIVELWIGTELEPSRNWSIAVLGGIPSTNVMVVTDQYYHEFTVAIVGESATVTMTLEPAPGWELDPRAYCSETTTGGEEEVEFRVAPPRLSLQVEPGGRYSCGYQSSRASTGNLTAPPTNAQATESAGPGVAWPALVAVMASVVAALSLLAVRSGDKHVGRHSESR